MIYEIAVRIRNDYCGHIFTLQEITSFLHPCCEFQGFKAPNVVFLVYISRMEDAEDLIHYISPAPAILLVLSYQLHGGWMQFCNPRIRVPIHKGMVEVKDDQKSSLPYLQNKRKICYI